MNGRTLLLGAFTLVLAAPSAFPKSHKTFHSKTATSTHTSSKPAHASPSVEDAAWSDTAPSKSDARDDGASDVTEPTVTLHNPQPPAPTPSRKFASSNSGVASAASTASKTNGISKKGLSKKELAKAQAAQKRQETAQLKNDRTMQRQQYQAYRRDQAQMRKQTALQVREARLLLAAQRHKAKQ